MRNSACAGGRGAAGNTRGHAALDLDRRHLLRARHRAREAVLARSAARRCASTSSTARPACASSRSASTRRPATRSPYEDIVKGYELTPDRYVRHRARRARGARPEEDEDDRHRGLRRRSTRSTRSSTTTRTTSRPARAAPSPTGCCSRRCARPAGRDRHGRHPLQGAARRGPPDRRRRARHGDDGLRRRGRRPRPHRRASRRSTTSRSTTASSRSPSSSSSRSPARLRARQVPATPTARRSSRSIERKAAGEEIAVQPPRTRRRPPVPDLMARAEGEPRRRQGARRQRRLVGARSRRRAKRSRPPSASRRAKKATAKRVAAPAPRRGYRAGARSMAVAELTAARDATAAPAPLGPERARPARAGAAAGASVPRRGRRARSTDAEVARAHPRARHPARLAGRVDLPVPGRPHPGDRHRRGAGASSTSTTRAGASAATRRSSTTWSRFARALPALRDGRRARPRARRPLARAGPRRAPCGCWTAASSASAPRTTRSTNETYGLATMRKEPRDASTATTLRFDYPAKDGKRRVQAVVDPEVAEVVATLKRRRGGGDELLAYKRGGRWCDVRSPDINAYLKDGDRPRRLREGLPHVGRDGARRGRARASPSRRARAEDRPQARDHARRQGGRVLPRQHAGGRARLLHRPARLRPLPRRRDDRRAAGCAAIRRRRATRRRRSRGRVEQRGRSDAARTG